MPNTMTLAPLDPRGAIDPDARIRDGKLTPELLDELCEFVVSDDAYDHVPDADIAQCYDGRPSEDENPIVAAKAAGGTETRVVGLALVGERQDDEQVAAHTARIASQLAADGHSIGGHTADTHGAEGVCGCGACDKLREGLEYIVSSHEKLAAVLTVLGIHVDAALSQKLAANAAHLLETGYVQPGPAIVAAIHDAGGSVENLVGPHLEGVAAINTVTATTLNKRAVITKSGGQLQAFGVDLWAMQQAAHDGAATDTTEHELLIAMLYHNFAIAAVLCGPGLRVVVR